MSNPQNKPAPPREVRVLLVDDHPLVRMSLREVIKREADLTVCGEAEDREQALALVGSTKPHLAIIDLTLKSSSGMDLIKDIYNQFPKTIILVLSMHDETLHAERAIRAGARGYITKQEAAQKIMVAIRTVLNGDIYWSERAAAKVASKVAKAPNASTNAVDTLADREMQVFELIGAGHTTRQIAAILHIDISTVETYRARIKEKLSLGDSIALLQFAIRWNIANSNVNE